MSATTSLQEQYKEAQEALQRHRPLLDKILSLLIAALCVFLGFCVLHTRFKCNKQGDSDFMKKITETIFDSLNIIAIIAGCYGLSMIVLANFPGESMFSKALRKLGIWLQQPIGSENSKYFLAMMFLLLGYSDALKDNVRNCTWSEETQGVQVIGYMLGGIGLYLALNAWIDMKNNNKTEPTKTKVVTSN